jgi:predicted DNA-binding transcriptional regulator YafY
MRSSRMFEIIQMLRAASAPCTAAQIATTLEVTKRTIYRDIASLQAMRVPIEGAAGVGYVMRPGYDLPAVNLDVEEAEAVTVGLSMIARTGDAGLLQAAQRAARKLAEATQVGPTLFASNWAPEVPDRVDMGALRRSIRDERVLALHYGDAAGLVTRRRVLPLAVIYYSDAVVLAAWCELRQDFRHFRADRVIEVAVLAEGFEDRGAELRRDWAAGHLAGI